MLEFFYMGGYLTINKLQKKKKLPISSNIFLLSLKVEAWVIIQSLPNVHPCQARHGG